MRALGVIVTTSIGLAGMVGAGFWAASRGADGSWVIGPSSLIMATAVLALSLTWSLPGDPRDDPRWRRRSRWTLIGCSVSAVGNGVWLAVLLGVQGAHPLLTLLAALAAPGYVSLALLLGERLRRVEQRSPQYWQRTGPRPLLVGIAAGAVLAGAMQFGLGRAVLRGRPVPDEHRESAARYAAIGRRAQAWLLTMLVLIYVMNAMTQLRALLAGENEPWPLVMLLGLTAIYAICLPIVLRQQRRLARYSAAHPVPAEPAT